MYMYWLMKFNYDLYIFRRWLVNGIIVEKSNNIASKKAVSPHFKFTANDKTINMAVIENIIFKLMQVCAVTRNEFINLGNNMNYLCIYISVIVAI